MPPIVYLGPALIGALLFYVFRLDSKKKKAAKDLQTQFMLQQAEKRTAEANSKNISTVKGSIFKTFEEMEIIRLKTPGYDEVKKYREINGFTEMTSISVAGVHTNNIRKYFDSVVKVNQFVDLVPEPTNPKNSAAIAIKMGRKRLGYIPNSMLDRSWEIYRQGQYFAYISMIDWDDSDKNYSRLNVGMIVEH